MTLKIEFSRDNNKKDHQTEDPFCFSMHHDVKNRIFAGKFSLDNGRNVHGEFEMFAYVNPNVTA